MQLIGKPSMINCLLFGQSNEILDKYLSFFKVNNTSESKSSNQFSTRSIWLIDGTLTGTTSLGQSGPGCNDTPQHSRTGTSTPDTG